MTHAATHVTRLHTCVSCKNVWMGVSLKLIGIAEEGKIPWVFFLPELFHHLRIRGYIHCIFHTHTMYCIPLGWCRCQWVHNDLHNYGVSNDLHNYGVSGWPSYMTFWWWTPRTFPPRLIAVYNSVHVYSLFPVNYGCIYMQSIASLPMVHGCIQLSAVYFSGHGSWLHTAMPCVLNTPILPTLGYVHVHVHVCHLKLNVLILYIHVYIYYIRTMYLSLESCADQSISVPTTKRAFILVSVQIWIM